MATTQEQQEQALAYVYDELSGSQKATFEKRLSSDPDLLAEVEGLRATRTMLDADMAYADEAGLDDPPSHLFDAILRAEALSRPPELKAAVGAARVRPEAESQRGFSDLTRKLAAWILGGGVAVGGVAAAVLFVVADGNEASPEVSAAMNDMVAAAPVEADIESPRGKRQAPAAKADDADKGSIGGFGQAGSERGDGAAYDDKVSKTPARDESSRAGKLKQKLSSVASSMGAGGGGYDAEPPQTQSDGLMQNAHGRNYPGAATPAEPAMQQEAKPALKPAPSVSSGRYARDDLDPPAVVGGQTAGEKTEYQTARVANMADTFGADIAERQGEDRKRVATLEESEDDENSIALDALASAEGAPADTGAPTAPAKSSAKGGTPANKSAVSKQAQPRASRRARPQRGSSGSAPRSSGPPVFSEKLSALLGGGLSKKERRRRSKAKKAKENPERIADQSQRDIDAEVTLASGNRQLAKGNYREADRMFEEANRLDQGRKRLGVLPKAGRVRALSALGRHQDALRIFAEVEKSGVTPGTGLSYVAAGASAEAIGDLGRAEHIYRQLSKVKATREKGKSGLARVQKRRARMQADQVKAERAAAEASKE